MSKRAEEAALKAYPIKDYNKEPNYVHTCDTKMLDKVYREVFKLGYMQAEKDLALTWEDIRDIEQIINQVRNEYPNGIGAESFGEEVLRRFNESRRTSNE